MKRIILVFFLFFSYYIYSQDWKEQSIQWNRRSGDNEKLFKGFSVGFLIQGQTKYPRRVCDKLGRSFVGYDLKKYF